MFYLKFTSSTWICVYLFKLSPAMPIRVKYGRQNKEKYNTKIPTQGDGLIVQIKNGLLDPQYITARV